MDSIIPILAISASFGVLLWLLRQGKQLKAVPGLPSRWEQSPAGAPSVTIIVPMRNEERNIEGCLQALLASDYPNFKVLVVDDESSDQSVAIVQKLLPLQKGLLRLINLEKTGEKDAWTSKKGFVLWSAAERCESQWLLFMDADTRIFPTSLSKVMHYVQEHRITIFSGSGVYPNPSYWGDLFESYMYLWLTTVMPIKRINDPKSKIAWMNGQFMLFESSMYHKIGGHAAVKTYSFDDLSLAYHAKNHPQAHGIIPRFLPDAALFNCINYTSLGEALNEWTRLICGGSSWIALGRLKILASVSLIFLTGILPYFLVVSYLIVGDQTNLRLIVGQILAMTLLFVFGRVSLKLSPWKALLLPVAAAQSCIVLLRACYLLSVSEQIVFKGRTVRRDVKKL